MDVGDLTVDTYSHPSIGPIEVSCIFGFEGLTTERWVRLGFHSQGLLVSRNTGRTV